MIYTIRKYRELPLSTDNYLQSRVICFLRFPLIVGVLFIHSQISLSIVGGASNIETPIFNIVRDLFSHILPSVSVPLFFIMSGYLFFYNTSFSKECYIAKLKKRLRTLLIPYLFWNGLYLLFNIAVVYIPTLSLMFKGSPVSLEYAISAFWGCKEDADYMYPIAYQFWFIRDLIVMVFLSPIFYVIIKYAKEYALVSFALLWVLDFSIPYLGMRGMGTDAIFFFMLGSWFSINQKNLVTEFRKVAPIAYFVYPLCIIGDICTIHEWYNIYIHNIGIIVGIVFYFNLAIYIVQRTRLNNLAFWSSASFFVFAIHDPWILTQVRKVIIAGCHPTSDIALIFFYFLSVLITVMLAVVIYIVLQRITPRFTALITGSR